VLRLIRPTLPGVRTVPTPRALTTAVCSLLFGSLLALTGQGCANVPADSADDAPHLSRISVTYPLDDTLQLNHIQAEGTHNSYHQMTLPIPAWWYTLDPLDVQAGSQGVRQFELDLHYSPTAGFEVYHVPVVDEGTSCRALTECLSVLKQWSDDNPGHHPLMVLLEPKESSVPVSDGQFFDELEGEILSIWPRERIITPDRVQGSYPSLEAAVTSEGWPTLGEVRDTILFVLHDSGELRDYYTYNGTGLEDRLMFAESSPGTPYAATLIMNDPMGSAVAIQDAVAAGYMVRTRADSCCKNAATNDSSQFQAALKSGAHWISTDFPSEDAWPEYYIEIPGGSPSGCNPISAPDICTSGDIENLP